MSERSKSGGAWSLTLAGSSVLSALALMMLRQTGAIETTSAYVLVVIPAALMVMAFVTGRGAGGVMAKAFGRHLWRIALLMVFYLATLMLAEHMIEERGLGGVLAAVLASLPGLSFAGIIWVFGALIVEEKDEFLRLLYVRQGLIATGVSLTLAAVWGFLELYQVVEHVAAYWWPTIWCFGIGIGGLVNKLAYGTAGGSR